MSKPLTNHTLRKDYKRQRGQLISHDATCRLAAVNLYMPELELIRATLSLTTARAWVERGIIWTLKGSGWLYWKVDETMQLSKKFDTYLTKPGVKEGSSNISLPAASLFLDISTVAIRPETRRNRLLSPRYFPGHILTAVINNGNLDNDMQVAILAYVQIQRRSCRDQLLSP